LVDQAAGFSPLKATTLTVPVSKLGGMARSRAQSLMGVRRTAPAARVSVGLWGLPGNEPMGSGETLNLVSTETGQLYSVSGETWVSRKAARRHPVLGSPLRYSEGREGSLKDWRAIEGRTLP
jgi:hypothetical protein